VTFGEENEKSSLARVGLENYFKSCVELGTFALLHSVLRCCPVNIMGNRRNTVSRPKSRKPGHRRQRADINTARCSNIIRDSSVPDILNTSADLDGIEQIPLSPLKRGADKCDDNIHPAKKLAGLRSCSTEPAAIEVCI